MTESTCCLVTGCAGFVGSHLAWRLLELGHVVVGVDDFSAGRPENMAGFLQHERFHFHKVSVTTPLLLRRLRRSHPALRRIFHLAAIVSVPYSMEKPSETAETNFVASVMLFEEAMELGFDSYVFAGSAAEYGSLQQLPLAEEAVSLKEEQSGLVNLQESPYGQSKFLVSRYLEGVGFGCSLRFFNIYGPRQDPGSPYSGVITRFVDQALSGEALTVHGDGQQSRDFIHVSDVVQSYLLASGLAPTAHGRHEPLRGVFNVGRQKGTTILRLAELINDIAGSEAGVVHKPTRPGDIRHSLADIGKFRSATGFAPRVGLEQGLRQLVSWTLSQRQPAAADS